MTILDTDTLTHFRHGNLNVRNRIAQCTELPIAITLITRIEILLGRAANILKAASEDELRRAVERFHVSEHLLSRFPVLDLNDLAIREFGRLLKQKKLKNIGRADLLIASSS